MYKITVYTFKDDRAMIFIVSKEELPILITALLSSDQVTNIMMARNL
jgi:hypothetical protein